MAPRRARARPGSPRQRGRLRIIGGAWRGRVLDFPPTAGLRPTPDRVRETLFNWLGPSIGGARCLDLFTGSGALGLEALSRGAASAVLVDSSAAAVAALQHHCRTLGAHGAGIVHADALAYLAGSPERFDVVFLDPPFGQGHLGPCVQLLEGRGWLAPEAFIYVEADAGSGPVAIPDCWRWLREKTAGQVAYRLARRRPQD